MYKKLKWNPCGNWVILIFSGQKPRTRTILKHTSFLYTLFNQLFVITPKKICYGRLRNKSQISLNEMLRMKVYLCFHKSCEIWNLFSGAVIRNCLLVLLQITNNFYCMSRALAENCKRECNMVLIILVQGFVFNNITQFPDGFCLNTHMNN